MKGAEEAQKEAGVRGVATPTRTLTKPWVDREKLTPLHVEEEAKEVGDPPVRHKEGGTAAPPPPPPPTRPSYPPQL